MDSDVYNTGPFARPLTFFASLTHLIVPALLTPLRSFIRLIAHSLVPTLKGKKKKLQGKKKSYRERKKATGKEKKLKGKKKS